MGQRDSLPGFLFNVEKWFGSPTAMRMSFTEKGVYLSMMFKQWAMKTHNLPDDPAAVAELIAFSDNQIAEVLAAWPTVRRKFVTSKHSPDRIYNVEIENTRRKQRISRQKRQEAGSRGGKAKAANQQTEPVLEASNATAMLSVAIAKPSDKREGKGRERKGSEGNGGEDLQASPLKAAFAHYHQRFLRLYGSKPEYAGDKDAARFKKLLDKHGLDEVTRRLDAYFDSPDSFVQRAGHTLNLFFDAGTQTKLIAALSNPGFQHNPGVFELAARRIAGNE